MQRIVLNLNDRRPAWALPAWVADEIRAAAPPDWEVVSLDSPAEGTGDGSAEISAEVRAALRDAVVYAGLGIAPEVLTLGTRLRWVHSGSAGVASSLHPAMKSSPVIFTNSAGVHGPPMAEAVIGMMLHFARGFDIAVRAAAERRWGAADFYRGDVAFPEIAGSVVGILGLGGIGREVAARARAFGARVLGLRRRAGGDVPPGVEVLRGDEGMRRLLAESDFFVVTIPETRATRGMIDAAALGALRPGAVVINVSRGAIIDEDALVDALRSGRLRGAALDVFAREPLPAEHPLWTLPNVLLTPHVSPITNRFWRRETDLIVDNLGRLLRGEPLRNVVDKTAGY